MTPVRRAGTTSLHFTELGFCGAHNYHLLAFSISLWQPVCSISYCSRPASMFRKRTSIMKIKQTLHKQRRALLEQMINDPAFPFPHLPTSTLVLLRQCVDSAQTTL